MFVVWMVVPENDGGFSALDRHLDALSPPATLELMESGDENEGTELIQERFTVVRVYASMEPPLTVCGQMLTALDGWGDVVQQNMPAGGAAGCSVSGAILGEGNDMFAVTVFPLRDYVVSRASSIVYWEEARTSGLATVVEVRAEDDG